ncbi:UDP-2,3-diacylglucosamine diphosphatase [Permianibacter aggregans]|uniref:UDP-2,3-diacylglucosamine pyrophosphatase LpxH n=1 Tax=Permianibacter aggregans TaxID=1510150 RepID=A0A4R6URB7_9GAMM|nr:UDP-2,3-diacylglucosamine diphosphatase [Permianibacter aggregans]TDQ48299.1 UDP-2,3-diacylglucosamine pyrophosphatase LpxH [Permianibacter aggregans]
MRELLHTGVRSVFLSDLHLGTRSCQAENLLHFLEQTSFQQLFLLGDIVDLLAMSRQSYWPTQHGRILKTIMKKARAGVQIMLIPGNHDCALRQFRHWRHENIQIQHEHVYTTAAGKRYWLIHGDRFDHQMTLSPALEWLGDKLNDGLVSLQSWVNARRRRQQKASVQFTRRIKERTPAARRYIEQFSSVVINATREKACDGVICGHIHYPQSLHDQGVHYLNTGDWVESRSAIVESHDGRLHLLDQIEQRLRAGDEQRPSMLAATTIEPVRI